MDPKSGAQTRIQRLIARSTRDPKPVEIAEIADIGKSTRDPKPVETPKSPALVEVSRPLEAELTAHVALSLDVSRRTSGTPPTPAWSIHKGSTCEYKMEHVFQPISDPGSRSEIPDFTLISIPNREVLKTVKTTKVYPHPS